MLRLAILFLVIALLAALFGFTAVAGTAYEGARILFFVFIVLHTLLAGRRVGANYWGEGATTLEWRLSSPPPFHSYDELPVIS